MPSRDSPENAYPAIDHAHLFSRKTIFRERLLSWFAAAMRPLPWRETYSPYGVWVSEIMLQQTQMERGVKYFNAWMKRFPDIRAVAMAEEETVLALWEGLGYYSRARNLRAAAKQIVEEHGGEFPRDIAAIRSLPGVGDYTAGAIASIAFNLPEPAVDANVLRIFARLCDIAAPVAEKGVREAVAGIVRDLIPVRSPRLFNQALMELGALVCSRRPDCAACPVAELCAARRLGTVGVRPITKGRSPVSEWTAVAGLIVHGDGVFAQKRPPGGLWGGLWELPGGRVGTGEEPEPALVRHLRDGLDVTAAVRGKVATVRHSYTTHRVTLHGYVCEIVEGDGKALSAKGAWIERGRMNAHAFSAGHRKLLESLGWK